MNGSYLKFPQELKPECFLEPDGAAESRAFQGKTIGSCHRHPQRKREIYLFLHVTAASVAQATTEIPRFAWDDNS